MTKSTSSLSNFIFESKGRKIKCVTCCVCISLCVWIHACENVFFSMCLFNLIKAYLVGFNESPVMSWSLWQHTLYSLYSPCNRNSLFIVWKEPRFSHVPCSSLDLSLQQLPHFLWGGKQPCTAQPLQGSNNEVSLITVSGAKRHILYLKHLLLC